MANNDDDRSNRAMLYIMLAAALGTGGTTAVTKLIPEFNGSQQTWSAAQDREQMRLLREEVLQRVSRNERDIEALRQSVYEALSNDATLREQLRSHIDAFNDRRRVKPGETR